MYPNNNQPISPSDYLNEIASQTTQTKFGMPKQKPSRLAIVGLGIAFVIVIIMSIIIGLVSGNGNNLERLAARLSSTEATVSSVTVNIKSTKLRALNSSLGLYLTNTIRDAAPIFEANGIKTKSLNSKIVSAESNSKMLTVLEDARLNAIYDRTYAREMAYQLDTVITLMRQIYDSTSNAKLKNFLSSAYQSLQPTQKEFADFNAANS